MQNLTEPILLSYPALDLDTLGPPLKGWGDVMEDSCEWRMESCVADLLPVYKPAVVVLGKKWKDGRERERGREREKRREKDKEKEVKEVSSGNVNTASVNTPPTTQFTPTVPMGPPMNYDIRRQARELEKEKKRQLRLQQEIEKRILDNEMESNIVSSNPELHSGQVIEEEDNVPLESNFRKKFILHGKRKNTGKVPINQDQPSLSSSPTRDIEEPEYALPSTGSFQPSFLLSSSTFSPSPSPVPFVDDQISTPLPYTTSPTKKSQPSISTKPPEPDTLATLQIHATHVKETPVVPKPTKRIPVPPKQVVNTSKRGNTKDSQGVCVIPSIPVPITPPSNDDMELFEEEETIEEFEIAETALAAESSCENITITQVLQQEIQLSSSIPLTKPPKPIGTRLMEEQRKHKKQPRIIRDLENVIKRREEDLKGALECSQRISSALSKSNRVKALKQVEFGHDYLPKRIRLPPPSLTSFGQLGIMLPVLSNSVPNLVAGGNGNKSIRGVSVSLDYIAGLK